MSSQPHEVRLSPTADDMWTRIRDRRTREKILTKLQRLESDPEKQGIELSGEFKGLRRIPVAGRYRAIYRVEPANRIARVLAIGIRKDGDKNDIYKVLERMSQRGEL